MSFSSRLTRCPRIFDAERAAEAGSLFSDLPPDLRDLLAAVASCSPFLKATMEREADWLRGALAGSPEQAFADVIEETLQLDEAELKTGLRRSKRRVALLVALADLGGAWDLGAVTAALTDFADLSLERAVAAEIGAEIRRGRIPGLNRDAGIDDTGFVALAMGKMGAGELNYSSDIDLVCLFDQSLHDPADAMEVRAALVRATRRIGALLSETSAEGYVFRTDLRLRPDPSVTPVCMAMAAAERYYESLGRSWERAAHIKARPAAGNRAAGERYLERLRPFIWRRHLDFAAIQDAHDIRLRIRRHRNLQPDAGLEGLDIKLGRGGIREIEFFTQTRQIIAGGRDSNLRIRPTVQALRALVSAGWVPAAAAQTLTEAYEAHRAVEHRLQMILDQQTHALPSDEPGFARLAALMDTEPKALRQSLSSTLEAVSELTEGFFRPKGVSASADPMPDLSRAQAELVARWRAYPSLRSERALDIFDRIKPALLQQLLSGARPDQALASFDGFLRGLPAGVQLFSLFEANPQLTRLITDIADAAPDLAQYLSGNAGVLDSVLGGDFFSQWPGSTALGEDLQRRLAASRDYESKLDETRRWVKDWHFRIGVHHLRSLIDGPRAAEQYCDLAGVVLETLWPVVIAEFARKAGPPPGRGAVVLGMGSLGSGRMTAKSDLDLIVVYDPQGQEASTGRRPLATRTYYARLTQSLVTALSAPTAQGRLYEVDMRLRPSGKQGPVAASLASYAEYQEKEAWTWEHLALTRARPVAGPADLCADVEAVRDGVLRAPKDAGAIWRDVESLRDRVDRAKPGSAWDAKAGAGRMQQIELVTAAMSLIAGSGARSVPAQIEAGRKAELISDEDARALGQAHDLFTRIQMATRLLGGDAIDPEQIGAGGEKMLLTEAGAGSLDEVREALSREAAIAEDVIVRVLRQGAEAPDERVSHG